MTTPHTEEPAEGPDDPQRTGGPGAGTDDDVEVDGGDSADDGA